jgi:geranylgeranyl diphosphate synthase type I
MDPVDRDATGGRVKLCLLTRYREQIEAALRDALAGETRLRAALRYHVGLEDDAGRPTPSAAKLLRSSLVVFTAEELGGTVDAALPAAVALELAHNFSLIHDDIQDEDRTRRGRPTLWRLHGVSQAINAGDLMATLAVSTALRAGREAVAILTQAIEEMIEGQALDVEFERRWVSAEEYLAMIDRKTGALLRCAFELGGLCAGADRAVSAALAETGILIGRAFQIRDDLLGTWGDGAVMGKPCGSDIRRRKKSLPVVLARAGSADDDRAALEAMFAGPQLQDADVAWVLSLMDRLEIRAAVERTAEEPLRCARECLQRIPYTDRGRDEMDALLDFLARREK